IVRVLESLLKWATEFLQNMNFLMKFLAPLDFAKDTQQLSDLHCRIHWWIHISSFVQCQGFSEYCFRYVDDSRAALPGEECGRGFQKAARLLRLVRKAHPTPR